MSLAGNSKRVIKNTGFLYVRMFIVMGVTIFTSRIILLSLGITDYGIMNVVGGIAFSFGFFSSSMTNATQRYLSFGHGQGNLDKVKEYFNLILIIFLIGSGLILIVGGGSGFWIVSKLNIPAESYWPAIVVYYTTLLSLVITLLSSAYDSVLIARERMNFYAYISIVESGLKLGIAYLIFLAPTSRLVIYSILSLGVTFFSKSILFWYCKSKFPECEFKLIWQRQQLKSIMGFIGWNGLGTVMWVVNEQGINILFNIFFGPVVNAARGIANQVNAAINNFTNNFFLALNPQIVKSYASGDKTGCIDMMNKASLISFYLLWMLCLPIIMRRDYILHLWLKEVPDYSSILLLWILIYSMVNVLTRPQWAVIQAVGNLRSYIVKGCLSMLLAIPVSYLLFQQGFKPQVAIIVMVVFRIVYVMVSLFTIRRFIDFPLSLYVRKILLSIIIVVAISLGVVIGIDRCIPETFWGLLVVVVVSISFTAILSFLMLGGSTRKKILCIIKSKI